MEQFTEWLDEIIALVIIIGCLILITLGIDSEVRSILAMGAAWVFGREFQRRRVKR